MNDFAKFLTGMIAVTVGLFLVILPGLLFVLAWNALLSIGVSVGWIILMIVIILVFLAWLGLSNFKELEQRWLYSP